MMSRSTKVPLKYRPWISRETSHEGCILCLRLIQPDSGRRWVDETEFIGGGVLPGRQADQVMQGRQARCVGGFAPLSKHQESSVTAGVFTETKLMEMEQGTLPRVAAGDKSWLWAASVSAAPSQGPAFNSMGFSKSGPHTRLLSLCGK